MAGRPRFRHRGRTGSVRWYLRSPVRRRDAGPVRLPGQSSTRWRRTATRSRARAVPARATAPTGPRTAGVRRVRNGARRGDRPRGRRSDRSPVPRLERAWPDDRVWWARRDSPAPRAQREWPAQRGWPGRRTVSGVSATSARPGGCDARRAPAGTAPWEPPRPPVAPTGRRAARPIPTGPRRRSPRPDRLRRTDRRLPGRAAPRQRIEPRLPGRAPTAGFRPPRRPIRRTGASPGPPPERPEPVT